MNTDGLTEAETKRKGEKEINSHPSKGFKWNKFKIRRRDLLAYRKPGFLRVHRHEYGQYVFPFQDVAHVRYRRVVLYSVCT